MNSERGNIAVSSLLRKRKKEIVKKKNVLEWISRINPEKDTYHEFIWLHTMV